MAENEQSWKLADLFESLEGADFKKAYEEVVGRAKEFNEKYSGKIAEIADDPAKIGECLREYEEVVSGQQRLYSFPALMFAANTRDKDAQKWQSLVTEKTSAASNYLIFLDLEIQKLPADKLKSLMKTDELAPYYHYFEKLLERKPHTLSEEVEKVLNETSVTGRSAFIQLRSLHIGSRDFEPVTTPEGETVDTEAELSNLLFHHDPDTRLAGYRSVRKVYEDNNLLYGYILQKIAQDHKMDAARRGHSSTLTKQLMGDEVPQEVYRTVIDVTREGFDLFQDYYAFKADRLGMEKVRICDIYAPPEKLEIKKSYDQGLEIIYEAMSQVDDEYLEIVQNFVDGEYIDSAIRKGKRGGAFCWGIWDFHPYVLLSYTGEPSSLFTLAHELGHGIHGILGNREQRLLGASPPMVLAEVASTFNELLLLDHLLETEKNEKLKRHLLTRQIEDSLNLLFRQTTISRLEERIHEKAATGTFDHEWVNEEWLELYRTLGGDSVEILPEHQFDWARIGHIFFKPFYCYNYCLSYMVSLACYLKYREEGRAFVPKFKKLLSLAGSRKPAEALSVVGVDPADPEIMTGAVDYSRELLRKLKALEG